NLRNAGGAWKRDLCISPWPAPGAAEQFPRRHLRAYSSAAAGGACGPPLPRAAYPDCAWHRSMAAAPDLRAVAKPSVGGCVPLRESADEATFPRLGALV